MRKYTQLTYEERYSIKVLRKEGLSNKVVARLLDRDRSTIGREINRNSIDPCKYDSNEAHDKALERRKKARKKSKMREQLKEEIIQKLLKKWSPEQISGYLKKEGVKVSHELIYQHVYADRKAGGKLYKNLRRSGRKYRKRNCKRSRIKDRVSIEARPLIVDEKKRIGDWEGDTMLGKGHKSAVLTVVDRKSKYLLIRKLGNRGPLEMNRVMFKTFKNGKELFNTLTVDNGLEFSEHKGISKQLKGSVYFSHPFSPWERGLNENTNGLIRQFFPKGTDFSKVSINELLNVQQLINTRPRKALGYRTPADILIEHLKHIDNFKVALVT